MSELTNYARQIMKNGIMLSSSTALRIIEQLEDAEERIAELEVENSQLEVVSIDRQQRAETAEAELALAGHDMDTVRYRSGLLENKITQLEAELARRDQAAGEPVLYALRFKNLQGVPYKEINDNCLFSSYDKARAYGRGGNYVTQLDGKIKWVPNADLDPEVIPLFTAAQPSALPPTVMKPIDLSECRTLWYEHDELSSEVECIPVMDIKKAIRAAGYQVEGE